MTLSAVKLVEEKGYTTQDGNMQTKKTRRGCPGRGEKNMPQRVGEQEEVSPEQPSADSLSLKSASC